MSEPVKWVKNTRKTGGNTEEFTVDAAKRVLAFHQSFPEYAPTPLVRLSALAGHLGLGGIFVKDESFRFGLNSFKVLGGSYAIGAWAAEQLGTPISALPYEKLVSREVREQLGDLTFVTATDGNHGRSVAWTANRLGCKSVVYMPRGSAPERLEHILKLGSNASITELCYDDAVRLAAENAQKNGWVLVQDTAWDGYESIPTHIMEGYLTMALETAEQLSYEKPTHIFLQAGVGSMAAAMCAFFVSLYGGDTKIIVVEPHGADCFYRTAKADDGRIHPVTEEMTSIMAGLCCGEPSRLAWDILHRNADWFISAPDSTAAFGMRLLGNPLRGDGRIISGESGACTAGLAAELMLRPELLPLREELCLGADSHVLCFSTEGDTDAENYRRIVWNGLYGESPTENI